MVDATKIYVVDSVMGSGKTSSAINYLNSLPSEERFIYVAPYLSEVSRILKACKSKKVVEPYRCNGKKLNGLYQLLDSGENIVTTHQLFDRIDDDGIELIKKHKYTCVIDETLNCISSYDEDHDGLSTYDTECVMKSLAYIDKDSGLVKWRDEKYHGVFSKQKALADNNQLVLYNDCTLMKIFPVNVLLAFEKVYVLTYLFEGSFMSCYFKYYNLKYENIYVTGNSISTFSFTGDKSKETKPRKNYKELIHIIQNEKMNSIGDGKYDLSYTWYSKEENEEKIKQMKNNLCNFFRRLINSKSNKNLWTTFEFVKDKLSGNGYSKGYIAVNTRASNDYADRNVIAYTVNRFMNTNIKNYFSKHGIEVDDDSFALNEMTQMLWRSAIRNDKPITVYIPSKRMRNLLEKWIEENSVEE